MLSFRKLTAVGIIPARAGFTEELVRSRARGADHPRSRGVYTCTSTAAALIGGSSPLARGLHHAGRPVGDPRRIIPARAGFTVRFAGGPPADGDHPRSRGVYRPTHRSAGSPSWIIPARAGFTPIPRRRIPAIPDHPRSRGVYWDSRLPEETAAGSSPLARGLPHLPAGDGQHRRIIPARAGFTARNNSWSSRREDHPRSRGVYSSP